MESFARNLSEAFVDGQLCVGDWAPEKGAKINVTLSLTFDFTNFPFIERPSCLAHIRTYVEETGTHSLG